MTQYNDITVKLKNSQLDKLKLVTKSSTILKLPLILRLISNMIGNSNGEISFPHKLLLTDIQVAIICKAFASNSSADIKLLKTQISKMLQLGKFLLDFDEFLGIQLGDLAAGLIETVFWTGIKMEQTIFLEIFKNKWT